MQTKRDCFCLFCFAYNLIFPGHKQLVNHVDLGGLHMVLSKPHLHHGFSSVYLSLFTDCRSLLQIQHIGMSSVTS